MATTRSHAKIAYRSGCRDALARLRITVVGTGNWRTDDNVVARVRATGADAVFLAGSFTPAEAPPLIRALRRRLPPNVKLLAPDGFFVVPWLAKLTGAAAEGMTISRAGLPLNRLPPTGARFVARFRAAIGDEPDPYSVYAAQATEVLLDAIARSDGTRASIAHELFATRVHDGLIGSFAITQQGDTTAGDVTIYRVHRGALEPSRVIEPSTQLTSH